MKIKINDYTPEEIIKIMKENSDSKEQNDINNFQTYEYSTVNYTFETLVKIAKYYHFDITIESTSKTDKMINHKY